MKFAIVTQWVRAGAAQVLPDQTLASRSVDGADTVRGAHLPRGVGEGERHIRVSRSPTTGRSHAEDTGLSSGRRRGMSAPDGDVSVATGCHSSDHD
jgi:hypothetical protein